ncbi:hypothetical protein MPH_02043 [Macrophomina phaseolina MS6]|uniref:Uncharacterized protein n=1 Tax=Macrophomina phaseolina (strain MS6) TaxID=1126212 RepID=K2S130_MACPH|nr:hypothetical protein MPH_02043 [Macrophomina phaseolina MS6]
MVEALGQEHYDKVNAAAQGFVDEGRAEDILPFALTARIFQKTPISARRWLSLASPDKRGADDFFSSDLDDEAVRKTFGGVPKGQRVCVLYSGADEFVPKDLDKEELVHRWGHAVREAGGVWEDEFGGVVQGATHNLKRNGDDVVGDLCRRVIGFLAKVEKGEAAHL